MSKLKQKLNHKTFISYFLAACLILSFIILGTHDKTSTSSDSMSIATLATNNFAISSDKLTEFYIVASLADSMDLNSSETLSYNYIAVSTSVATGQSSTERIEKPTLVDTSNLARGGIKTYIVAEGDTMESIAAAYGVTTDQIRWSNGKKTTAVTVGETLYIPGVSGIVYTVKSGDTLASILEKTGASETQTIILNDKESDSTVYEGERLILADGTLPEKERPEYVAPVVRSTYTYLGSTASRIGLEVIGYNWTLGGQCVGYAIWWRNYSGKSPLGPVATTWGNANAWARNAAKDGYTVNRTPEVGAVFQTTAGFYGHVGVVVAVNDDGSIVVEETNYYRTGAVTRSTISADQVGSFNYIH